MLRKEDIDNWNESFPACKLSEKDLAKPTTNFVTNALVVYLRAYNEKVEPPITDYYDKEKRTFQIRLVQRIDSILKISKGSYGFTYFDLMQPTTKKIALTLNVLYNYYCYYNMYKAEAFATCDSLLSEQQRLQLSIRHAEELNQKIAQLTEEKVKLTKQNKIVSAESKTRLETLAQMEKSFETHLKKLDELKTEQMKLQLQLVPDKQAQQLKTQLAELTAKLQDTENAERALSAGLSQISEKLEQQSELLREIEALKMLLPKNLQQYENYGATKKSLETKLQNLENEKATLLEICQQHETEIKCLKEQQEKLLSSYQQMKWEKVQRIKRERATMEKIRRKMQDLHKEEHHLIYRLNEQKEICAFIHTEMAVIMEYYFANNIVAISDSTLESSQTEETIYAVDDGDSSDKENKTMSNDTNIQDHTIKKKKLT